MTDEQVDVEVGEEGDEGTWFIEVEREEMLAGWWVRLKGANGEIIMASETYTTHAHALDIAESLGEAGGYEVRDHG